MSFVRRFREQPTIDQVIEIEGPVLVDSAPPDPVTGSGTGVVLLVGEFEDGPFASDSDINGSLECFGTADFITKFGNLGYTYSGVVGNNASARRHLSELWNGNGYLKAFNLQSSRLLVGRVDTSVGQVSFDIESSIDAANGPYVMTAGDDLSLETNSGAASSTAVAAATATVTGSGSGTFIMANGDQIGIKIDGGPTQTVTFSASDTSLADVITRINDTLGYTAASDSGSELKLDAIQLGTGSSIELIDTVAGTLAKINHVAGTTDGTGNVANLAAVTVAELLDLINIGAISAIDAKASNADGKLRISCTDTSADGYIKVDTTSGATNLGISILDTAVAVSDHPAGSINAGTRVRASGTTGSEWVTMQTLDIPAGVAGPFNVKVRHALDDGNGLAALAGAVDTVVDSSDVGTLVVNNAAALTAALDENQLDNAYLTAFNYSLDDQGPAKDSNYLLSARRSDNVVRFGRDNAINATQNEGLASRIFVSGDPIGTSTNEIVNNITNLRSGINDDYMFYTGKALRIYIPTIAERGLDGGLGFTSDGFISVRPDTFVTSICATRPPEENPGQPTGLGSKYVSVDTGGERLTIESYKAYKRNGVMVPRYDSAAGTGMVIYSGITSSLESGRTNASRRKMANYIGDTLVNLSKPYIKKLTTKKRKISLRNQIEQFLGDLLSEENINKQRIKDFKVDDSANAGNTSTTAALNVHYIKVSVQILPSMDNIVFLTSIGNSDITITEQ